MNDGKRINFSLDQGKYEIRVTLTAPKPLRVEWRGAPYCDYKGGANVTHVAGCTLQGKGGVVTDNPALPGLRRHRRELRRDRALRSALSEPEAAQPALARPSSLPSISAYSTATAVCSRFSA